MSVIGVDGCRAGWFYVQLTGGRPTFGVVHTVAALLDPVFEAERILIDIPIGLRDKDGAARGCDTAARQLLGSPRQSSVFPAPVRAILEAPDYNAARAHSRALTGKSPSKQTFGIMPKIREIDLLMRTDSKARSVIREAHPELCFWGLGGGKPMIHKKSKAEGFHERLEILRQFCNDADVLVDAALSSTMRKDVARDDVLDALVCALVAAMPDKWVTAPPEPETDSQGLPMQIVYALKNRV
jgi:predicted RNase H-like nuclease